MQGGVDGYDGHEEDGEQEILVRGEHRPVEELDQAYGEYVPAGPDGDDGGIPELTRVAGAGYVGVHPQRMAEFLEQAVHWDPMGRRSWGLG